MKKIVILLVIFAGLAIFMSNYLSPDDIRNCQWPKDTGDCQKVDAVVAISGGDTNSRADEAIELYKKKWAKLLIFSGAAADKSGPSNAKAMLEHALKRGVDEKDVIIEEKSENTKENAKKVKEILEENGVKRIILITSGYHQRRAGMEFQKDTGVKVLNHPTSGDQYWTSFWWLTPWGWWLALGEMVRIVIFYVGLSR